MAVWKNRDWDVEKDNGLELGPYGDLFKCWTDTASLSKVMYDLCEYHCEKSFEDPKGFPEFIWEPYNVFPVDILAIRRIRTDLGLETPSINHPLMASPLAKLPDKMPESKDELWNAIRERAIKDLPGVEFPS